MKIFIGEFNESDVTQKDKFYIEAINNAIAEHGHGTIENQLVEYKGKSYYFRRMKTYLIQT